MAGAEAEAEDGLESEAEGVPLTVEVGSAAFKEGLKLHVTGVGGGKMEAEGYPEVVEGKDKGRPKSVLIWCKISASRFESLAICSWT